MNEKDDEIAYPGMVSNPKKRAILSPIQYSPWTGTSSTEKRRLSGQSTKVVGEMLIAGSKINRCVTMSCGQKNSNGLKMA
jgi:hypothetical protein